MNFIQNSGAINAPTSLTVEEKNAAMNKEQFQKRIASKYADRPFVDDNMWWYYVAIIGMAICNVLNLVTGTAAARPYLSAIFGTGIFGVLFAWLVALAVPALLEYAQWRNGISFWERFFFKKKVVAIKIVAQLFITAAVVFLSYQGAPELVAAMSSGATRSEVVLDSPDAITAQYQPQIDDAKKAAADFKKSRSWLGKLSIADGKTYNNLLAVATNLEKEMNGKIDAMNAQNAARTQTAELDYRAATIVQAEKDRQNGETLAAISIIAAILFNLFMFLKEKYEYFSYMEFQNTTAAQPVATPALPVQQPQNQHLFQMPNGQSIPVITNPYPSQNAQPERRPIGFVQRAAAQETAAPLNTYLNTPLNTPANGTVDGDLLKQYKGIVKDLETRDEKIRAFMANNPGLDASAAANLVASEWSIAKIAAQHGDACTCCIGGAGGRKGSVSVSHVHNVRRAMVNHYNLTEA